MNDSLDSHLCSPEKDYIQGFQNYPLAEIVLLQTQQNQNRDRTFFQPLKRFANQGPRASGKSVPTNNVS